MDSTYNLHVHIVKCRHNAVQFTRYYYWHCNDRNITTDIPHLTLMGELWGVNCEDLGKNWPPQHGTALYVYIDGLVHGRRNSNAFALEPSHPHTNPSVKTHVSKDHFIFIYMYKCINSSWYPQKGVLHIFFINCHQSLRQWRLTTIRPRATAWTRDDQCHWVIECQIQLTWNGLEISSSNSIAEKIHEYWQYLKKYNTDIIINKIRQKEKETQLGLSAPSLVQRIINHKQITSDVTDPIHKGEV